MRKGIAKPTNIRSTVKALSVTWMLTAITLLSFPAFSQSAGSYTLSTVVIDAGHGGHDPGTHGKRIREKDLVLKIALKVGHYIETNLPDVKVIYTRKDDTFIPLDERADIANRNKAGLFLSIHANASPSPDVHGTETWVMGLTKTDRNLDVAKRENSVILLDEDYKERYEGFDPNSPESQILFSLSQSAFQESSLDLAARIEQQFSTRADRKSLGVKQGPFWVLWRTAMPSVLVEIGYLTNASDESDLGDPTVQDYIASAIFRAFRDYKAEVESISALPGTQK